MIIRRRSKPLPLKKLDTRLPTTFPRYTEMEIDAQKRRKGYVGEQQVDYHLEQFADDYIILQDVNLKVNGKNVQLDNIIITEYGIIPVEVKNYDGTITFNTALNTFTRSNGEVEQGYKHPITQAENQQRNLQTWLQQYNLQHIPVYFFVAISDPRTVIKVVGDEEKIGKIVAHGENIPKLLREKVNELKSHDLRKFDPKKVGHMILNACENYDGEIMKTYQVQKSDLLTGVHCPSCKRLGMRRIFGNWLCLNCNHRSKYAHHRALDDYLLLIRPFITNKACMRFLHLESRGIATRILQHSNLLYDQKRRVWRKKRSALVQGGHARNV
ncbi:nuclease-related domain-containing protein [Oceanobacillus halotolerans]|uniref:nuclease-related domain-containing protein n=1 Tax=Oceanobacillus halotolerans TaxID=2663380 RepID=UPI0013D9CD22|nr:nuclease-related domain-containing protein [Oceanobacillus halotolerans]